MVNNLNVTRSTNSVTMTRVNGNYARPTGAVDSCADVRTQKTSRTIACSNFYYICFWQTDSQSVTATILLETVNLYNIHFKLRLSTGNVEARKFAHVHVREEL